MHSIRASTTPTPLRRLPGSARRTRRLRRSARLYNNLGAQTAATFSSSGQTNISSYDALGRLTSSGTNVGGIGRTLGMGYDLAGNRLFLAGDFGYHAEFTYDTASRMLSYVEGGTALAVTMAYDMPARLQSITPASGAATTYTYDPVARLQSLTHDLAGTGSDAQFSFTYNPASQIATRGLSNDGFAYPIAATSKSYAVNGLNQYTTISGTTYTYDANGNLTSDGINSYTYDAENRLMSATTATQTVTLTYDPLGRLNAITGSTSGTTRFLYDGDELIREYDGTGTVRNTFVHGVGIDDPLVDYGPGGRRFLHKDHQGSIVALSDNAGNPVAINRYDEYGNPAATNAGRFGYTGQIWIAELGLWYYKARFYSSSQGRFLQVDPIGYDDQINLYAYVGNDPTNKIDPDGETEFQIFNLKVEIEVSKDGVRLGAPQGSESISVSATKSTVTVSGTFGASEATVKAGPSSVSVQAKVGPVAGALKVGNLPKPPTGRGAVPKDQRDPVRRFSPSEREQKRQEQGGRCATGCGTKIDATNSEGHHRERHADGGRTVPENHDEVCKDCHKKLHEPDPR